MEEPANTDDVLAQIWGEDLLGRREEAATIQSFIEHESADYLARNRMDSLVLAIDAQYGEGKSWFLDRLAEQLALSHPVARIDAWADDASEEPLTAFMASIDDALAPYLTTSDRLKDKLAAAKVAALPVMGRLVKGILVKGLTKIAGEGADQALGDAFDGAVESAKQPKGKHGEGVAAAAVEGAMEELGKEIDSLVDRRGAAMLAEYRQRKKSREGFRTNMRELVAGIDDAGVGVNTPLVVIIDELDRCRPDYAIRVLEEIKHFFDVPGVVFILAIYGEQLRASISAVYGEKFASEDYLRRFFDRRWELRRLSAGEMVATQLKGWGELGERFSNEIIVIDDKNIEVSAEMLTTYIFDACSVTPREALAVLDAMRLFAQTWSYEIPISTLIVAPMAINLIRQRPVEDFSSHSSYNFGLPSVIPVSDHSHRPATADALDSIRNVCSLFKVPLEKVNREGLSSDSAYNFSLLFAEKEVNARRSSNIKTNFYSTSLVSEYTDRLERISGLVESVSGE